MKIDEIIRIISQYSDKGRFSGGVSDRFIEKAELQLRVTFPKSYKWFLREYGSGGILGITISGVQENERFSVVSNTERYRKFGLDDKCVVIQDCGEFAMCLDTSKIVNNECPIVSWERGSKTKSQVYNDFYDFFFEILDEAVDNWDDEE